MSGGSIKFMTYNVWSCERVAVYRRIKSICEIIEQHDPDVIFLQEVTEYIYTIFQEAPWWGTYQKFSERNNYNYSSPLPFCLLLSKLDAGEVALPQPQYNTWVPRAVPSDLLSARVYTERHRLRAATCWLEPSSIGYEHRRARASAFLEHFDADAVYQPKYERTSVVDENVVLGGDLRWDDDLHGPLPLGDGGGGWVDAWLELRGGDEAGGWTYDAVANPMLRGLNLPVERKRPDRFICRLRDFTLDSIQRVGVDAIPGVTRFDDKKETFVPVRPSHHFGLLLTIKPKHT